MGILISIAALYLAVAALGAVIFGMHAFLPLSVLGVPPQWITPVIVGVVAATLAVAWGLFGLSDSLVYRLIGSPTRQHVAARPKRCYLCGGDLLRNALTCPACGALVRHLPEKARHTDTESPARNPQR